MLFQREKRLKQQMLERRRIYPFIHVNRLIHDMAAVNFIRFVDLFKGGLIPLNAQVNAVFQFLEHIAVHGGEIREGAFFDERHDIFEQLADRAEFFERIARKHEVFGIEREEFARVEVGLAQARRDDFRNDGEQIIAFGNRIGQREVKVILKRQFDGDIEEVFAQIDEFIGRKRLNQLINIILIHRQHSSLTRRFRKEVSDAANAPDNPLEELSDADQIQRFFPTLLQRMFDGAMLRQQQARIALNERERLFARLLQQFDVAD